MGRLDFQVKIRGFRIELGEIESRLREHEAVDDVVVVAKEDASGIKYLCAYIVLKEELAVSELRSHISQELPEYMIPSYFVRIESIPLTPNGKVNRKALPEPDGSIATGTEYAAPTNDTEEKLVEIWQEVLGLDKIGINENFFELGGHSLLAVKLVTVMEKYRHAIENSDIYKYNTVKQLTAFLNGEYKGFKQKEEKNLVNFAQRKNNENISSSTKYLENIEPFDKVFYKNCFYNSVFPVVDHFGKSIIPFLYNDIVVYTYDQKEKGMKLNIDCVSCEPIEQILDYAGLSYNVKARSTDIISDIINSIDHGRPVIIWVDCYYESIRADMYMKNHLPHTWLVFGYDTRKKTCGIIEHRHSNSLSYEKITISFDDIVNGHNGYQEYFGDFMNLNADYYEFYTLDYSNIEKDIVAAQCDMNLNKYRKNIITEKPGSSKRI